MHGVRLLKLAEKELASLNKATAERIAFRINWLASEIEKIRPEPLTGDLAGLFKLRVGDYRVIYEVMKKEKLIVIHMIGHRRDIYRRGS